jgi:hypothetical protein
MGVAIMHSLSELTLTKMAKEKSWYTMIDPATKVEVESGLLMIKVYLKLATLDTGGIALVAEQQIIKMPDKFETVYGNDPIIFLDELQTNLNTLDYNGDSMKETQVVTVIFNALRKIKQELFKTWIEKRYDEFEQEPRKANSRELMLKIREKVSLLKADSKWDPDAQTPEEEIVALKAEMKEFAQQQGYTKMQPDEDVDSDCTTPPKEGEPTSKMMISPYSGILRMHHWCPKCQKWVVHTEHQDGYRYQATLAYKAALERIEREYRDNDDDEVQEIETGMESDDEMYEE